MESRWKVRELNAVELVPDRKVITVNSPLSRPDISDTYQGFKSSRLRSRRLVLYKYQPPPVKSSKVVKHKAPRFINKIPCNFFQSLRNKASKSSSPTRVTKGESQIDSNLKTQDPVNLPPAYSRQKSLKDRFITPVAQTPISEHMRYFTPAHVNWHGEPVRKWEKPAKFLLSNKSIKKYSRRTAKTPGINLKTLDPESMISNLFDSCEDTIMKINVFK